MIRKYPVVIAVVALWCILSAPGQAAAQILDNIEVTTANGSTVIRANFSVPVRYVKHFPAESAKTLEIYLQITAVRETERKRLLERRSVRAPVGDHIPVRDVTYEGDGLQGPRLIVHFSKTVTFIVRQGEDSRSILISIPRFVSKTAPLPPPAIPNTTKTAKPAQVDTSRKEPDATQRPDPDLKQYAVTLALSFTPFTDLTGMQKDLKDFPDLTVYQVTTTLFGFKVYFVRLGFFAGAAEANAASEKLRTRYPAAWVTLVTGAERVSALRDSKLKSAKIRKGTESTDISKGITPQLPTTKFDTEYPYVLNLESSVDANLELSKPLLKNLEKYRLYTMTFNKNGQVWRRLRLGFFATKQEAERLRQFVERAYPHAWIDIVSREEVEGSVETAIVLGDPKFGSQQLGDQIVAAPTSDVEQLMARGREALTRGDNVEAIRTFSKVLALPKTAQTQSAQEYLGLATERNGQLALAKVEYKLYLKLYPEGEGADRVRQRLANLSPPEERRQVVALKELKKANVRDSSIVGSISQDYYRGKSRVDATTTVGNTVDQDTLSSLDQSSLLSYLDLTGRFRNTSYDSRAVLSASFARDFLDVEDETRVSSAYFDILNKSYDYSARVGRQSASSGGVLSRFDGGRVGYSFLPKWRVNAVAGIPADDVAPESDRRFYGASLDMGPFAGNWNGSTYIINQDVDGITDRRAVGAELRYFDPKRTFFSLVDYDIYFSALNIATLQGSWQPASSLTFNLLLDYRKSPPLQATNALLGQTMESTKELLQTYSEEEVKQIANALTATAKILALGGTYFLTKRLQLGGDISVTNISETEGTADVPAAEGSGNVITYSTQLIGSRLLGRQDVSVFTLSYTDSDSFTAHSLSFIERLQFRKSWRFIVGLRVYDQRNDVGSKLLRLTPTVKLDYQGKKNFTFEIELSQERTKLTGLSDDEDTTRDFIRLGYRRDF